MTVEIHADAAGRDDQNLIDEWVRFTNEGSGPLDLAGWTVADESSGDRSRSVVTNRPDRADPE